MPMDLVLGRTLIGRQLINEGKIKIKDGASKKDVDDLVQVISYAGNVSMQAYAYMNRMLMSDTYAKGKPGTFDVELIRDEDNSENVSIDQYFSDKVDLADIVNESPGKQVFRVMHFLVERWEAQTFLGRTNPTLKARLGTRGRLERFYRVHDAAIDFNNKYLRPLFGASPRSLKHPKRHLRHWSY